MNILNTAKTGANEQETCLINGSVSIFDILN